MAKFSEKLTIYLIKHNIIDNDEIENYTYCFQIFFSTLINIVLILFISCITNQIINGILFLVYFGILRLNCGGFHFNNYMLCIGVFNLLVFFILLLLKDTSFNLNTSVLLIFTSLVCILIFAPRECKNKKLTNVERNKYKKNIHKIIPCLVISLIMLRTINESYATFPIIAIVTSAILLLL